jgi:hypothetical protein
MNKILAIVEYKAGAICAVWKLTNVDCTPLLDSGITDEEAILDWAFEKNCTEGYTLHNYNFFNNEKEAEAWVKANCWIN